MGYTTEFFGAFEFDRPVDEKLKNYINKFSQTRRMFRDAAKIKEIYPNWAELCFNGKLGTEGEYFTVEDNDYGQTRDDSIINYNEPPTTQPGLWCQWVISDDGKYLKWDGGEKFYNYVEWLEYLIVNFFIPSGYQLSGKVEYQGESISDAGTITVKNNLIYLK